jgi:filamentous hemagglutinin family protein
MKIQPLIPLCSSIGIFWGTSITFAQTVPASTRIPVADGTLGTQVSGTNNNFSIMGGLNKGQNLFHSFQDFSVPTGGAVTFSNPTGNQAIITRVTGNLFSDIDGIINTQGANFFLINPNGILFGANTQLNVGQTFVGTTANGIDFVDAAGKGYRFGTNGNDAPLLTIDPNALLTPARLIFSGNNGAISNLGILETSNYNQYIGLFGGNVTINGGQINAQGGRVEIGGLSAAGTMGLGVEGNIFRAQFPTNVTRSDISFTNQARVNVAWDGGGNIAISARNFELLSGSVLRGGIESGLGTPASVAGDIKLNATGNILIGGSNGGIGNSVRVDSIGQGGNIDIQAGTFSLQDNAQIQASTAGTGSTGNINLRVTGAADISGTGTAISSAVRSTGRGSGGNITIGAGSVSLRDAAQVTASTFGVGDVGNVKVTANTIDLTGADTTIFSSVEAGGIGKGGTIDLNATNLSINNGAELSASTSGQGKAGNVVVNIKDTVSISDARITSNVEAGAVGNGGTIDLNATNLWLTNAGQIQAGTRRASNTQPAGQGDAGNINVKVTGAVDISGTKNGFSSGIFSLIDTGTVGTGGNITIESGNVSLRSGATLDSSTDGTGNAGNITLIVKDAASFSNSIIFSTVEAGGIGKGGTIDLNARSVSLQDGAQLVTNARFGSTGDAGTIKVTATDFVTIAGKNDNGFSGLLVTSASQNGAAGDLTISAPKITLDNGGIIAAQSAYGNGGNINISNADLLILRHGSKISATAAGTAQQNSNGGNITINLPNGFLVTAPNENSDITANAFGGKGGKVSINTQQNFWIAPLSRTELEKLLGTTDPTQLDPVSLPTNNITAISQINPNLSGQINITPPGVDITAGLTPLPNSVTDPTNRINPNCSPRSIANNSFTSVGRGGIPATPKDPLNEQEIASNWVRLNPQDTAPSTSVAATPAQPQPLVEAQSWRREMNGDIVLAAQSTANPSFPQSQPASDCPTLRSLN